MLKNEIKELCNTKKYLSDYKKKSNPDYWKENDISQELNIEDMVIGRDGIDLYRSIYYNIDDIYSGMAIFKALTNKTILDALDSAIDVADYEEVTLFGIDTDEEAALSGFCINISLYKNNGKYDNIRDANIAITLSNEYGGIDIAHQDIEDEYLKEKLISITKEIIK